MQTLSEGRRDEAVYFLQFISWMTGGMVQIFNPSDPGLNGCRRGKAHKGRQLALAYAENKKT